MRPWDQMAPEQQEARQLKKLRRFLSEQILPFHPYYGELFREHGIDVNSLQKYSDLAQIPLSSKGNVAPDAEDPDRPKQFVLQPTPETLKAALPLGRKLSLLGTKLRYGADEVRRRLGLEYRPVQAYFTTGRTALPTSFFLSKYDLGLLEEVGIRIATLNDVDPSVDRLVSLFPYAPHLAFWQVQAVGVASGTFMLQTGGGKAMGSDGILRAIGKVRPSFICGIPGYTYHLIRKGVEEGRDFSFVKTLFLGGDRVTPDYRVKLCELLRQGGATNPRVVSILGFTEAKKCWTECVGGEKYGFHTYPDLDLFEMIDPDTGLPVPDGETGEMVYTPLDGRGSLILRYRTGDIVAGGIVRERCPGCGRTVPRFSSDLSRRSNLTDFSLTKIKGTLVNLNVMSDLLTGDPRIDEWQLVIRKRDDDPLDVDELILYLALLDTEAEAEVTVKTVREIERSLADASEVCPTRTEVLPREELLEMIGMETLLKEKRIVDLRKKARAKASSPGNESVAGS
mgnify:CR=1 FL=1